MALAVTWRGDRSAKFRCVLLAAAVMAVTLFVCAAVSAAFMADRVDQRAAQRNFRQAAPHETADLQGDLIYDSIHGEQIFVYLYRLKNPNVSIAGLADDAQVGDWFVSPELARLIKQETSLQRRYFDARLIGNEGVGSADELVAVRLVGPEASLGLSLVDEPAAEYSGLNAGVSFAQIMAGAAVVLVASIGLLRAAVGPVSVGLQRRLTLLNWLGATRMSLWKLQVASTALIAVPAAAAAAASWQVIAPRLSAVPVVGQRTLEGDLSTPIATTATAASVVVVMAALIALRRPYQYGGLRLTREPPSQPSVWRLLPLVAALSIVAYATTFSGTSRAPTLFIVGLIATPLAVTLALPVLIDKLGASLAQGRSVLALLVGRSLSINSRHSARSLTALASVAVLVPAAVAYVSVARTRDPAPPDSAVQIVSVRGDLTSDSLDLLEREAGGVFTELYQSVVTGDVRQPPTFTWVADCGNLERFVVLLECSDDGIVVEPAAEAAFVRFDAGATRPPEGAVLISRLFVTDDVEHAEEVLRYHLVNNDQINMSITSPADEQFSEARSVAWILGAVAIGAVVAVAALLLSLVTEAARSAKTRMRLVCIGADLATIRRLAAAETVATMSIVGLGAAAIGTICAMAYTLVDGSTSLLYWPSLLVAATVIAAAAVAALASYLSVSGTSLQEAINAQD